MKLSSIGASWCGVLALTLLVLSGTAMPSIATAGPQVTVNYPLSGRLTSSPLENPPHHRFWGDFALDAAAGAGTAVHARFSHASGNLSLSLAGTFDPCRVKGTGGSGVIVNVAINGQAIGSVRYAHLSGIPKASGTISNGEMIGRLYTGARSSCWTGPHVHIEPLSSSGYACFVGRPLNSAFAGENQLGVVGGQHVGGINRACPPRVEFGPQGHDPEGAFDSLSSPAPGRVSVRGWAFDRDNAGAHVSIHAYVGGEAGRGSEGNNLGAADTSRPDVNRVHGTGANHGFERVFTTRRRGNQPVCLYAINIGGGNNRLIGCKTIFVENPNPIGSLDGVTSPKAGMVQVRGWTFDRSDKVRPLDFHVYVGPDGPGREGHSGFAKAKLPRPDVNRVYPGVGNRHGFKQKLPTGLFGDQRVCVYGINVGFGENDLIGCKTVRIEDPNPFGNLDSIESPAPGRIRIQGWSLDRSSKLAPTGIHVYVGGSVGTPGAEGHDVGKARARRPDVGDAFPGTGKRHGFKKVLPTKLTGLVNVCAYAINIGVGANREIGCKPVEVAPDTVKPRTRIVRRPARKMTVRKSKAAFKFRFRGSESFTTLRCKLDGRKWFRCGRKTKVRIRVGRKWRQHRLSVVATDFSGNKERKARVVRWRVKRR